MSKYLLNNSYYLPKMTSWWTKPYLGGRWNYKKGFAAKPWAHGERTAGWEHVGHVLRRNLDRNASVINMVVRRRITGMPTAEQSAAPVRRRSRQTGSLDQRPQFVVLYLLHRPCLKKKLNADMGKMFVRCVLSCLVMSDSL